MPDDPLSQAEIDSLLGAVSDEPPRPRATARPGSSSQGAAGSAASDSVSPVRQTDGDSAAHGPYQRPRHLSPEQLRAVHNLHDRFCRRAETALSSLLRVAVEMKLRGVDERSYSEVVFGLENPSCFNVLRMEPGGAALALDVSPAIAFPLIERLLGGGGETIQAPRRPLTEIELRLMGRITQVLIGQLQHAWSVAQEVRFSHQRVASDPQITELMPPNCTVIRVGLDVTIRGARGGMTLCLPLSVIKPIAERLAPASATHAPGEASPPSATMEQVPQAQDDDRGALVELAVELAETTITPQELHELSPGDVITTPQNVAEPVLVRVEGLPKFRARIGRHQGHRAIRIEERVHWPGAAESEH